MSGCYFHVKSVKNPDSLHNEVSQHIIGFQVIWNTMKSFQTLTISLLSLDQSYSIAKGQEKCSNTTSARIKNQNELNLF